MKGSRQQVCFIFAGPWETLEINVETPRFIGTNYFTSCYRNIMAFLILNIYKRYTALLFNGILKYERQN